MYYSLEVSSKGFWPNQFLLAQDADNRCLVALGYAFNIAGNSAHCFSILTPEENSDDLVASLST